MDCGSLEEKMEEEEEEKKKKKKEKNKDSMNSIFSIDGACAAPYCRRRGTMPLWPCAHAVWRGVEPPLF